jgi:hypothetical protein
MNVILLLSRSLFNLIARYFSQICSHIYPARFFIMADVFCDNWDRKQYFDVAGYSGRFWDRCHCRIGCILFNAY